MSLVPYKLPVKEDGLKEAIDLYRHADETELFIDSLGLASMVFTIKSTADFILYKNSIKEAIQHYIGCYILEDAVFERAVQLSLGIEASEYEELKSNLTDDKCSVNHLKDGLDQHSENLRTYPNAFFEIARTRPSDFCLFQTSDDREVNPDRKVLESRQERSFINLFHGEESVDLVHPILQELNDLAFDLINYLPFVYICIEHKGDSNWICRIDTKLLEHHDGYRPLVREKSRTPLGLLIKVLKSMNENDFKYKTLDELPLDTGIKCSYPMWDQA